MKRTAILVLLSSTVVAALAQETRTYPEHGIVVVVHDRQLAPGFFAGGGASGLAMNVSSHASCRVETASHFVEFSMHGKTPKCTMGQAMDFRVAGSGVYVAGQDGKEHKYRLVSVEAKKTPDE